ncbi:MAG: tRNA dihydrouridine synthase DusB [bacterium]|uniref:tRNA-dihydrouridine synthase n=2 Tax=Bacteria candidate phyla TaxID=1783234 RepID=A0A101I3P3_UNCT6|nr:MAG: tRNA-dihydrouridine synthase [candidate division TA06 bacterium 32_111]KUK87919.1 MAG: tRNA-dihydrouridine synthase [candidate division TA06 bacterium 34_109]MDI6700552.1 tRNA dihydrouridine synthase DusB [bacterium]HAF08072.1 tRNA dihydrouridine synthase DusB [candidate division WOR-3 bacterium]HCP16227.1 tRNA dihydrouridine synthase DusB [candidate division WOR-3 bacterium]
MDVRGKIFLAPLAGITDTYFRRVCKWFGVDITYSELISADGLYRNSKKTFLLTNFSEEERPFGIQIFGKDPEILSNATMKLNELLPDFLDINLGCSVKKVVKQGYGSALLKDFRNLKDAVISVVSSTRLPVSCKMRLGYNIDKGIKIAQILQDCGVSFIAVHGRVATSLFSGKADWESIKKIKENVNIPVIGNGDLQTPEDALILWEESKVDGIMIGRGSLGNPWIFKQIKDLIKNGKYEKPSLEEKVDVLRKHYKLATDDGKRKENIYIMRKHFHWYLKGVKNIKVFKERINRTTDYSEIMEILKRIEKNG